MQTRSLRTFVLLFLTLIITPSIRGQVDDGNIRLQVLQQGIKDSTFIFGKWNEKGQTETWLRYLGDVKTKDGREFRVMNSVWLWGLSCRATPRILIFNNKNQYLGEYYVGAIDHLPAKLENGKLVFSNIDNNDCDKRTVSYVNLKKGLPKEFFRKCRGDTGDFYSFANY